MVETFRNHIPRNVIWQFWTSNGQIVEKGSLLEESYRKIGKTKIFQTTENMVEWLSPELYLKVNALFAAGIKLFPKTKREKMRETIEWKYSNAGKIQNFTFWALAKIHPYCLRILKSTDYHICLKFWTFRFDLRKKRTFANQTTENEIWQFWTSKCQPAQSGKVFNGLFYKKKTVAREKLDKVSMDEWSLERMKEQDPRWERVKRSFSQQLLRSTYQKDSIAVANSQ